MSNHQQPISLLLCALGGEGGGILTDWLVEAARHAGYAAQSTAIPGLAQRTGATTYYIEVFPVPLAQLGGKLSQRLHLRLCLQCLNLNCTPRLHDLLIRVRLGERDVAGNLVVRRVDRRQRAFHVSRRIDAGNE